MKLLDVLIATALGGTLLCGCAALGPAADGDARASTSAADQPAGASDQDGCGPASKPDVKEAFDAYEGGGIAGPGIDDLPSTTVAQARESGFAARLPTKTAGLDVVGKYEVGNEFIVVLAQEELPRGVDVVGLIRRGGVMIVEQRGGGSVVERVLANIGDEATEVRIGPYDGAINHGDEMAPGVRPWALWFSDGQSDYVFRAGVTDPRDLIDIARSLICD